MASVSDENAHKLYPKDLNCLDGCFIAWLEYLLWNLEVKTPAVAHSIEFLSPLLIIVI